MGWKLLLALCGRAVRDPRVAVALARVGWRFRRRDWARHFPFLPVPDGEYLRWRMHTAYGRDDALPAVDDVVRYARWATREP